MSVDFIARLIGMVVFSILGVYIGSHLGSVTAVSQDPQIPLNLEQYTFTFGLVGALFGLILTPYFNHKTRQSPAGKTYQNFCAIIIFIICWFNRWFTNGCLVSFSHIFVTQAFRIHSSLCWRGCIRLPGYHSLFHALK